uniref:Uncharacterized protein n=2 Tax=viral metagenome TaxID=1070528 RepID=A0A6M3XST7_9ZZZZ
MALKVKPIEASTTKWSENASRAAGEYAENALAAADTWATNTKNAADTFQQAISSAGMKNRFLRGVAAAGASKYGRKIADVARDRFGPGISAATQDYRSGAEPYFQTLASISLSQRKPRGDPSNYRRVEEVGKALNAKRMAILGSSGG